MYNEQIHNETEPLYHSTLHHSRKHSTNEHGLEHQLQLITSCCVSNIGNSFLFLHKCDFFIMENKGFCCFLTNISQHIV